MHSCPFCELASGRADADLVAHRTPHAVVVPALKQRRNNRGHMLILPASHWPRATPSVPPARRSS
jgi:hypothetical protein